MFFDKGPVLSSLGNLSQQVLGFNEPLIIGEPIKFKAKKYTFTKRINVWPTDGQIPENKLGMTTNPFLHIRIIDENSKVYYHRIIDKWGSCSFPESGEFVLAEDTILRLELISQTKFDVGSLSCSVLFEFFEKTKMPEMPEMPDFKFPELPKFPEIIKPEQAKKLGKLLQKQLDELFEGDKWKDGEDNPFGDIPDNLPDDI